MEILFATTSDRKKNDLQHVIDSLEINKELVKND